jgi:phosphoribosylamine-glycine ligase
MSDIKNKKNLIFVSKDFSGLGFAKMSFDGGYNVLFAYKNDEIEKLEAKKDKTDSDIDKIEAFYNVGNGIVEKVPLDEIFGKREKYRSWYWIFDQNYLSEYADRLREEGFPRVFGTSRFTDRMEHDRKFSADIMRQAGFDIPETVEFSDLESGISFIEEHNKEAWVFKPEGDQDSYMTFVPSNWDDKQASRQVLRYMKKIKKITGKYVLQKRIKGVEINVEAWIYKGTPFFAFCTLENKRKLNYDAGCHVGCSQDIVFTVPLESQLVRDTIGKTFSYYKSINYTGFADVNCIIADDKYYFLEVCNRFGYNSHPNLFKTLAIDNFGDIMTEFIDGKIHDFHKHFRKGFGASILVYNEHPRNLPIEIEESLKNNFYEFDIYVDDDGELSIAGSAPEVGIVTKHGWTIEEAARECLDAIDLFEEINFPDIGYRSDLDKDYGAHSPIRRYRALETMGLL